MQVIDQIDDYYDGRDTLDEYQLVAQQASIDKAAVLDNWMVEDVKTHETKRQAAEEAMRQDKVALKYPKYAFTNLKNSCSELEFVT